MWFALEKHSRTRARINQQQELRGVEIQELQQLCYCSVFFFLIIRCMDGPKVRAIIKAEWLLLPSKIIKNHASVMIIFSFKLQPLLRP